MAGTYRSKARNAESMIEILDEIIAQMEQYQDDTFITALEYAAELRDELSVILEESI